MTPLAQRIMGELALPRKDRTFDDKAGMLSLMDGIHCFECSEVFELACEHFGEGKLKALEMAAQRYSFLPAPKTWIEFYNAHNKARHGFLLIEDGDVIKGMLAFQSPTDFWSMPFYFLIPHIRNEHPDFAAEIHHVGSAQVPTNDIEARRRVLEQLEWFQERCQNAAMFTPGLLAFINTPRVIGRRQHMPHAGLQRKIAKAKGMVGKFPLHAWTEIKLEVMPPRIDRSASGDPHEARLTGAKALHFCRCHLRVRLGQLELVSAHWRGDPALGMKQSRYVMVPPRDASPEHPTAQQGS